MQHVRRVPQPWVSWVQGLIDAAEKEQQSAAAVREAAQVAIQKAALVKEAEVLARNQKAEQARLEREAAGRQNAARMERLKQVRPTLRFCFPSNTFGN